MIGWGSKPSEGSQPEQSGGFDTFEMRLGDLLRGERATLGKSLLDVQRELKIKAAYISAIENCDPSAFDTPGFIAGYVRSYSRYLGLDPDETFASFCRESGFAPAHGMSEAASARKPERADTNGRDSFTQPLTPFTPDADPIFAQVEPRAIGSLAVLLALIGGLGYGGWTVLNEVQRVQFAPLDQTPQVASEIDPLAGASAPRQVASAMPSGDAFDRLYRPEALDLPVMVARDAPISTLIAQTFPETGAQTVPAALIAQEDGAELEPVSNVQQDVANALAEAGLDAGAVQVTADPDPGVALVAVRPVWVRVRAADGSVILEKILNAGEEYPLPPSEEPATLRAGNSGSLFFKVAGHIYGPAGEGTSTAKDVALAPGDLQGVYQLADLRADDALAQYASAAGFQQP